MNQNWQRNSISTSAAVTPSPTVVVGGGVATTTRAGSSFSSFSASHQPSKIIVAAAILVMASIASESESSSSAAAAAAAVAVPVNENSCTNWNDDDDDTNSNTTTTTRTNTWRMILPRLLHSSLTTTIIIAQYSNRRGSCCECEGGMYRNSTVAKEEEKGEKDYDDDDERATGYTETERFLQCLDYHRALLFDYTRRWEGEDVDDPLYKEDTTNAPKVPPIVWPRNVPTTDEIPALELDLQFCLWSPGYRDNQRTCQNQAFRIASYYLSLKDNPDAQHKGYFIVKDLAHHGHPDGMCLYAMILYNGSVPGVQPNPAEAVVWWRRCVELHRHITATFELGVAMYTAEGEGVTENPELAVRLFRQAAHLGHAGAAYMLGECLLDGVGVKRDRANALEWLVTAAELGHQLARRRVMIILKQDYDDGEEDLDAIHKERMEEAQKWTNRYGFEELEGVKTNAGDSNGSVSVHIERRHTRGALTPRIAARRKSKVIESRDEVPPVHQSS